MLRSARSTYSLQILGSLPKRIRDSMAATFHRCRCTPFSSGQSGVVPPSGIVIWYLLRRVAEHSTPKITQTGFDQSCKQCSHQHKRRSKEVKRKVCQTNRRVNERLWRKYPKTLRKNQKCFFGRNNVRIRF